MKSAETIFHGLSALDSSFDGMNISVRVVASAENKQEVELWINPTEVTNFNYTYFVVTIHIPCAHLFGHRVIYGKDIITKELEDYLMTLKIAKNFSQDALKKRINRIKEMRGLWKTKRIISVSIGFDPFVVEGTSSGPLGRMLFAPLEDAAQRALLRLEKENEDKKISFVLEKNSVTSMSLSEINMITEADLIHLLKEDGSGFTYTESLLNGVVEFGFAKKNVTDIALNESARVKDIEKIHRKSIMNNVRLDSEREEFWRDIIKPFLLYFLEEAGARARA